MIIYLLKATICTVFFLFIYLVFLEKEKMHQFNRYYLLLSLVAAFLIPVITFEQQQIQAIPIAEDILFMDEVLPQVENQPTFKSSESSESYGFGISIYHLVYIAISAILFIRFVLFLLLLITKSMKNKTVGFSNSTLVLIEDKLVPHSFLNYIFINKFDFENGNIPKEILLHEKTHVNQLHSMDVLIVELLIIFFWFNPVLYLYRKAIQLNHEFLADEAVIQSSQNVHTYQSLLISSIKATNSIPFSSQFNFSITKKRFIMMTKTKSSVRIVSKQIATIPVILLIIYFFSNRIPVQAEKLQKVEIQVNNATTDQKPDSLQQQTPPFWAPATKEGATEKQMLEYEEIVNKYRTPGKRKWVDIRGKISTPERERLESIFLQMSREQQLKQNVIFIENMKPFPKINPTSEQFESWKDGKMYGVWIDGKRAENILLEKYDKNDFSHVFVSGLAKNAKNYGKHYYQVDLMTNKYFENFNKECKAKEGSYHIVLYFKKPKD